MSKKGIPKITEAEREKMVSMLTGTGTHRPDELAQLRTDLLNDQSLMEKVRDAGVKLTVRPEQLNPQTLSEAHRRSIIARMKSSPSRYSVAMARPSGMPTVRTMLLLHMEYEQHAGAGVKPLKWESEHDWQMYFATADFASLFAEMQHDFHDEQVNDYLSDILEELGPNGQIIVGFDLNRVPIARVSKSFSDSTPFATLPPDKGIYAVPNDPQDRMKVAAMAFQWRTDEDGATALFGGLRSIGDTFRTTGIGSETTRDVILMVWMLASRQLRMLEATPQRAQAGLPPKAKDKRRSVREDTVTVVTLRKHVKTQVDQVQRAESGHHLTHRFVVRGHWRNQAYGTNRALRRRTYILPYVKGPQDAPFIEREKVYQW